MLKSKFYAFFLIIAGLLVTMPAYAFECPDVIEDAGKDTAVHYKIQKFSWSKFKCERSGGIRKEGLPLYSAERCAAPRIDGCSLHEAHILFTGRDKKLMTPSCNVHDLCYSTYHEEKNSIAKIKCDAEFGLNLEKVKRDFKGSYSIAAVVSAVLVLGDISGGQTWAKEHHCGIN